MKWWWSKRDYRAYQKRARMTTEAFNKVRDALDPLLSEDQLRVLHYFTARAQSEQKWSK